MAKSINPHLSPGFHPKVGQVLELQQAWTVETPEINTLSRARQLEMKFSAC